MGIILANKTCTFQFVKLADKSKYSSVNDKYGIKFTMEPKAFNYES
jgi:hypothetical protein